MEYMQVPIRNRAWIPLPYDPQSGYLGGRETRGNMRETTLERAAAESRECADYSLLSTHSPNSPRNLAVVPVRVYARPINRRLSQCVTAHDI